MSLSLGLYDIFTYAIPGSLYLGLIAYVVQRLEWLNLDPVSTWNAAIVSAVVVIASFLAGHATYQLRRYFEERLRWWRRSYDDNRRAFLGKMPAADGWPLLSIDPLTLLAGIEVYNQDAANSVVRIRAVGLMVRSAAPPMLLGAAVAGVEIFANGNPAAAASAFIGLLVATLSCMRHGQRMSDWADIKTWELAFWMPDLDAQLDRARRPE